MSTRKKKPRTAKVRAQDTARQRRKRERDAQHLERVGAETMKLTTYRGARADLALMQQVGGFDEPAEVITLAVRYLAGLARHDPAAFLEAMNPRNPV